ncbi:FAD-dependent oxidoreductase [Streptomyces sp. ATCC 21386]|uniref:FAD-dependent oxidoreductase n=1 Tax=Streptomyces sp. ATCC 21386 TaxID=2699428 RepID=UPI0035AC134B
MRRRPGFKTHSTPAAGTIAPRDRSCWPARGGRSRSGASPFPRRAPTPSSASRRRNPRTSPGNPLSVDGGYTGLWAAYFAKKLEPSLSVAVFEAEQVGDGASGRNGGWLSAHPGAPTNHPIRATLYVIFKRRDWL